MVFVASSAKSSLPHSQPLEVLAHVRRDRGAAGFEDFDFTNWFGLLARTGTPQSILDRLAAATVASLKDPEVRDILTAQAAVPVGNTPAEFREFIRAESERYAKVVALTGVTVK